MGHRPDDEVTFAPGGGSPRLAGGAPDTPARRFAPGSVISGRYRLVALLGRGGMGEVYRADDLTLDQPVALKFLPEGAAADPDRLAQFHTELRVARQVSHKNVCRLYDLGDADGLRFITMEYVDGEDLAALLRRIGRVPQDKALEIARQLCAGVAAAHERGVLHRDLKPANVMLDGDGNVRITDFGLAAVAGGDDAVLAGTPQYMAPEQLRGQPASMRSDIYALGLVLFEIFTGRRAYDARSLHDLRLQHEVGTISTPSAIVRELDPAVERVILRCLERDPAHRPGSAMAVAAALPGGDPLAAALAAGETPSPEMLAAAGETEALPVARGLLLLAAVAAGLLLMAAASPRIALTGLVPLDKPPAVLADRAQQIAESLGYREPTTDAASGFAAATDYIRWIAEHDRGPRRWEALRTGDPPALVFWHRTSPRPLSPERPAYNVTPADPPLAISGMRLVIVDTRGRLREFHAVPPQVDTDQRPASAPRWEALFEEAGLAMASFSPVTPQWTPREFADTRAAWEGPLPERADTRIRVEAAAYRGRPVSMYIVGPWTRASRMQATTRSRAEVVINAIIIVLVVALVAAALLLARHSLKANRADRRGAARLSAAVIAAYVICWTVDGHHVADANLLLASFIRTLGSILFVAALLWTAYVAVEPYVRRFWPDGLLGWSRLLSGRLRDPRVGRDILVGCAFGMVLNLLAILFYVLPPLGGRAPAVITIGTNVATLLGLGTVTAQLIEAAVSSVLIAMFLVLAFVLLRLLLKRTALAVAAGFLLIAVLQSSTIITAYTAPWITATFQVLAIALMTVCVVRFGLLVTAVMLFAGSVTESFPFTLALSHWSATTSMWTVAAILGLAVFGFYSSRAGQPLFGNILAHA